MDAGQKNWMDHSRIWHALPRSTNERMARGSERQTIWSYTRYKGLSVDQLRQVVNLDQLTGYTITVDCDVLPS